MQHLGKLQHGRKKNHSESLFCYCAAWRALLQQGLLDGQRLREKDQGIRKAAVPTYAASVKAMQEWPTRPLRIDGVGHEGNARATLLRRHSRDQGLVRQCHRRPERLVISRQKGVVRRPGFPRGSLGFFVFLGRVCNTISRSAKADVP
jgi:hypothetical protein